MYKNIIIGIAIGVMILSLSNIVSAIPSEQWDKTFGGKSYDSFESGQQTSDGGYILGGSINENGSLIKTDNKGNKTWSITFKKNNDDLYATVFSVQQTTDNGYIIGLSKGGYVTNMSMIKLDQNRRQIWSRNLGDYHAVGMIIRQTTDGNYIILGTSGRYLESFLIKVDSGGNELWKKTLLGIITWSIDQTVDGGFIIGGNYINPGGSLPWIEKIDKNGNTQWNKTLSEGIIRSIKIVPGGYILAGDDNNDGLLIKTNSNGSKIWSMTIRGNGTDYINYVQQTTDGYILMGNTHEADDYDIWLVKVSAETPIQPNTLIINVQNATTGKPLKDATMRISYNSKYGIILANASNKTSISNEEGMTNIFFKHKEGDTYIYIHVIRASAPWSSCALYKDDSNINNKVWECKLSITGPQIMATKNTLSDRSDGGPAYARLGWTKIKNDHICVLTKGSGPIYRCDTDKNFTTIAKDFHDQNPTVFKPFKIEKYVKTQTSDYDVLGFLKEGAIRFSVNNIPIPLPVLAAIMSQETGCRWKERNSCSSSQWRYDSYLGQYRTLVTFDGGIGAMQLTGDTALYGAELLGVQPDIGIGNLSGSFKNNIIAGAGILNSKDNVITNRNNTSSWGTAICKYRGENPIYCIYINNVKARIIPFYPVSGKYIEDNSLFSHNSTYVSLGQIWGKSCNVVNGLWECS